MAELPADLIERLNSVLDGLYRIDRAIGEGGMARVFLARDLRHERRVAIKVLKADVAAAVGSERFLTEIRTTANLQHPHILPLHDSGQADGFLYFVTPYVEGESLRDRLDRVRQLPVEEAVSIAVKVAGALQYAHEHGIVHRDIKPGNVLLQGSEPIVADFGIALAVGEAGGARLTETGLSLGTPNYMSPEQAIGDQATGPPTDVWALACLLYELLVGEPPYTGATGQAVLGRIITQAPDRVVEHRPKVPANVDGAILRGLEKVPADRFHSAGDFAHALTDPGFRYDPESPSVRLTPRSIWNPVAIGAVAVAALALAFAAWTGGRADRGETSGDPVSALMVDLRPADVLLGSSALETSPYGRNIPSRTAVAIDPAGRMLAFTAGRGQRQSLFLRNLGDDAAAEVPGTEGAEGPIFSPDGSTLAYWADGAIWRIPVDGGPPVRIADARPLWGAVWSEDDRIVYSQQTGIWSVPVNGGSPSRLTELAGDGSERSHVLPEVLPGGDWLLYTVLPVDFGWDQARIVAHSLETGDRKTIADGAAHPRFLPTGHLVYTRLSDLMAVPFDGRNAEVLGGEVGVRGGVLQSVNRGAIPIDTGAAQYAISSNGTLAYVSGEIVPDFEGTLLWIDRDGSEEEIPTPTRPFFAPQLSPDGESVAVGTFGFQDHSIFRYELSSGSLLRLTVAGWATSPVWSPDGSRLAINLAETGPRNLYSVSSEGGEPVLLDRSSFHQAPGAWTPDGTSLVFLESGDIHLWSEGAEPNTRPLIESGFFERHPDLSPDGQWLALVSDETGRPEVYVAAYPDLDDRRPVSTRGGMEPAWSGDGSWFTYLEPLEDGQGFRMMLLPVTMGDEPTFGAPRPLFELPWYAGGVMRRAYDLTANAERFLFVRETYPPAEVELDRIHLVLNWLDELEERVPSP